MKRFFSYDPEIGFDRHATADKARESAESSIDSYRDGPGDGWADEAGQVCWGEINQESRIVSDDPAPEGSEFDRIADYGLVETQVDRREVKPCGL